LCAAITVEGADTRAEGTLRAITENFKVDSVSNTQVVARGRSVVRKAAPNESEVICPREMNATAL
jgi:hypothetical protein